MPPFAVRLLNNIRLDLTEVFSLHTQDTLHYLDYSKSADPKSVIGNPGQEWGAGSLDYERIDQRAKDIAWPPAVNTNKPSRPSNHAEWSCEFCLRYSYAVDVSLSDCF